VRVHADFGSKKELGFRPGKRISPSTRGDRLDMRKNSLEGRGEFNVNQVQAGQGKKRAQKRKIILRGKSEKVAGEECSSERVKRKSCSKRAREPE